MPITISKIEQDLRGRWRPSEEQIAAAVAALAAGPAEATTAVVPLALPGKLHGIWDLGQVVEPGEGCWLGDSKAWDGPLAYHGATDAADRAAVEQLGDREGQSGYATIGRGGSWAVWEGFAADRAARRKAGQKDSSVSASN